MNSPKDHFRSGRKAEQRTARRMDADATPVSGILTGAKGDMARGRLLIESKATGADSLRLQYGWLNKIHAEAREKGLEPALAFQYTTANGQPRKHGAWVALPEHVLLELLEEAGWLQDS